MPSMQFEVPTSTVLLPLAVVLMAAAWLWLRRRAALTWPRLVTAWTACGYALGVVAVTMLPLQVAVGKYANQIPWYERGNLIPLVVIDAHTFVLNIVMMVPLGLLLPLLVPVRGVRHVATVALGASATIEVLQYVSDVVLSTGRTADVNDLFANVLGGVLGYLVWRLLARHTWIDAMKRHLQIPAARVSPVAA